MTSIGGRFGTSGACLDFVHMAGSLCEPPFPLFSRIFGSKKKFISKFALRHLAGRIAAVDHVALEGMIMYSSSFVLAF